MTTHALRVTIHKPGEPDTYKAACRYISHDPAEFKDPTDRTKKIVTCTECLKGKKCRKCNEPGHIGPNGYQYQLCTRHLRENVEAFDSQFDQQ
jgi:hypothetical protein